MIRIDAELASEQEALGHIERALESLRQKLLPHNPTNFAIYSEGYVEQIEVLQTKINDYLARKMRISAVDNLNQSISLQPTEKVS